MGSICSNIRYRYLEPPAPARSTPRLQAIRFRFVLWNLFTLLGAIGGAVLGDPRTYGLDAAVGGAFLALLWPRLQDRDGRRLALASAAVALLAVPLVPSGLPVLVAGGVALVVGVVAGRREAP